jgi:hypothetical protein
MNVIKRCYSGAPFICPAATTATYPLKVWDTCDCPIASKPWSNGYSGLLVPGLFNTVEVTEFCQKHATSGFVAPCMVDMALEDGCCSATCWEKLNTIASRECAKQYLAAMCKYPDGQLMAYGL